MNAAVLVQQAVGANGELVMDELSGMAVAQGVELCAAVGDGLCTAMTIGSEAAESVLREAIAWGRTCNVMIDGLLLADPTLDDSDTPAAARTFAAALIREGPFDLVLLGSGGELGPEVAELLDLPFVAAARYLSMQGGWIHVRGQHEDGWLQAVVELPAVVSCAAGLADPCTPEPAAQALVPHELIRVLPVRDIGPDPSTVAASASPNAPSPKGPIAAVVEPDTAPDLDAWGADTVLTFTGSVVAEDVARAVTEWALAATPEQVLLPSSTWGREVAGRLKIRLSSQNVAIEIVHPDRASSPRRATPPVEHTIAVHPRGRVRVASRTRGTTLPR